MSAPRSPADDAGGVDPRADGWTPMADEGFVGLVGPFWRREEAGRPTRYGFVSDHRHVNLLGVVQGGMLMTFADRALGLAAWQAAGGQPCSTVQFNMQFVAAAPIGVFIELEPRVVRVTKSLVFLEGVVRSGETEQATAQGLWKRLSTPSGG